MAEPDNLELPAMLAKLLMRLQRYQDAREVLQALPAEARDTTELATLRALGYSPVAVAGSLLQEALLVGFLGGALGCGLALLVSDVPIRFPMGAFRLEFDVAHRGIGLIACRNDIIL